MSSVKSTIEVKQKEFSSLTENTHSKEVIVKNLLSNEEYQNLSSILRGFDISIRSKIMKRVDSSLASFIDYYQTFRYSTNNSSTSTDVFNLVVDSLERCNILVQDPTHHNGVAKIKSINKMYHKYLGEHRLNILFREKINVDYNVDLSNKTQLIDIAKDADVPFEMFIALLYSNKVLQCKERDIKFELTISEFSTLYKKKSCFYSGIELSLGGDHSATIDRLDSTLGYVKGNCVICSSKVNQIKNILLESSDLTMGMTTSQIKRMFSKFIEVM